MQASWTLDPVEFLVRKGFQSLAGRTLELLQSSMPGIRQHFGSRDLLTLSAFADNLKLIMQYGDVYSIGDIGSANLGMVLTLLGSKVPEQFKPYDHESCRRLAFSAVGRYHGIQTEDEFARKAGLEAIHKEIADYNLSEAWDGQGVHRAFYYSFDPRGKTNSLLTNTCNLEAAFQHEQNGSGQVVRDFVAIPGVGNLLRTLEDEIKAGDSALGQSRASIVGSSHLLNFFRLHGMLGRARQAGADADTVRDFLEINIPRMNFIACYSAGAAYSLQDRILGQAPELQGHDMPRQVYMLLALTNALLAPFTSNRGIVCRLGIGLYEHFENHPEIGNVLRQSSEFHQSFITN